MGNAISEEECMMKIAGIQFRAVKDLEKNVRTALSFIDIAIDKGAKIICLPELSIMPWIPYEKIEANFKYALNGDDPIFNEFKQMAKKNEVCLIVPFFEKTEIKGVYYNSAMVINTKGRISGVYRKIHLPLIPYWEEKFYFKNGDVNFPVFKLDYCKIGVMIGWDVFFPEASRSLTLNGADIIFAPTASAFSSQPRWLNVISANALMNTVFIVRVNRVGEEGKLNFYGGSFCCNPDGSLISEPAGADEGIVLWDIDLNLLDEIRKLYPFLRDRNEKEYLKLVGIDYKNMVKKRRQ